MSRLGWRGGALERAASVVTEQATTVVPPPNFDRLVASPDEPDEAPQLAQAAEAAMRSADRRRVTYGLGALGPHHDLDDFRCGTPTLDGWLRLHSRNATGQGTRTYVLVVHALTTIIGAARTAGAGSSSSTQSTSLGLSWP